ncbi:uncharacterized protein SCHCODRAFT_01105167 [Schizophyllum commune H4-8]|nr:uncharacterized protein SCHCODRAFT_01105167 [Schizophyllum commune H4-8]KAI5887342.1 hypothetical protein SCHCODRAFT_01105167 [Schizophyllum commune H4-8]
MCLNHPYNAQYIQDFVARLSRSMRKRAIRQCKATSIFTKRAAVCAYCSRVVIFNRAYDLYRLCAHMRDYHYSYGRVWADGVLDDTQTEGWEGLPLGPRVRVSASLQQQLAEGGTETIRGAGYVSAVTFSEAQHIVYL